MKPEEFNLLLVDDDPDLRECLQANFEMDDYNVFTASGGNEAYRIIQERKIHFVVSDIRMPNGDGETLLKKVREMDPKVPEIVFLSGYSELSRAEAIRLGARDFLLKPTQLDKIDEYINCFLENH